MSQPSAILFDLDGTLLDTAPEFVHCLNILLQETNRPLITLDALRPIVSLGSAAMVEFGFQLSRCAPSFEKLKARFLSLYQEQLGSHTQLFAGITQILDLLTTRKISWGIVTNKHTAFTLPLLQKFNVLNSAQCIVCGDTLLVSKPHPDPLWLACQQLNVSPQACWYIGDAKSDVLAAQAAGMRCAIAEYGYLPLDENVVDWQADYYLTHPFEIAQLFSN